MNTRPVFVEKKMLKQHGIRRLFGAGALFFGLFLLVAVVSWVFREEVYRPGGYGSGNELALYLEENGVGISARSMGNVNVQVIMEQLGGGGHQTMAATQLKGCTIQEAKEQLLLILEAQENEN